MSYLWGNLIFSYYENSEGDTEKPASEISESLNIDINSKKIKFIDHVYAIIYSALHGCDLTDTSIDNGISKSWLSKLNGNK